MQLSLTGAILVIFLIYRDKQFVEAVMSFAKKNDKLLGLLLQEDENDLHKLWFASSR